MTSRSGLCFGSLQMGEALSAPPPLVQGSGHAEARGEAAGASLQKEYFGCGGCGADASPAVRPAPARRSVSALRLPEVPRCAPLYAQRSLGPPGPLPAWGGQGVWCGRHE